MKKTFTLTALLFTVMSFASIEIKANDYASSVSRWLLAVVRPLLDPALWQIKLNLDSSMRCALVVFALLWRGMWVV
jgi:hypothetical protein